MILANTVIAYMFTRRMSRRDKPVQARPRLTASPSTIRVDGDADRVAALLYERLNSARP